MIQLMGSITSHFVYEKIELDYQIFKLLLRRWVLTVEVGPFTKVLLLGNLLAQANPAPKKYKTFLKSMKNMVANLGSQVESQRIVTTRRLYQRTIPASIKSSTKDLSLITT